LAKQGAWGQMTSERFAVSNDPVGEFVRRRCRMGADLVCDKGILFDEFESFRNQYALSDKMEANRL